MLNDNVPDFSESDNPYANKTILLIDEPNISLDIDRAFFANSGFNVLVANSSKEAFAKVYNEGVHIAVVDVVFERQKGLEIVREIKTRSLNSNIKTIITGIAFSKNQKKSAVEVASSVIEKPVPKEFFLKEVKKLLEVASRDSERIVKELQVTVVYKGNSIESTTLDVSGDGLLLGAGKINCEKGDTLSLVLTLPVVNSKITVEGEVVRFTKDGIGIRFHEMPLNTKRNLDKFLISCSLESRKSHYYL